MSNEDGGGNVVGNEDSSENRDGTRDTGEDRDADGSAGADVGANKPAREADGGNDVFGESANATNEVVENPDINDLLDRLDALEESVDDEHERQKVRQTITLVERMPGSEAFTKRVRKYTTRDIAESFVGSIVFALPLLVEGGVFEIATYFAETRILHVPIFFVANLAFVVILTTGLLFYADFRNVVVHDPLFGLVPRRLVGVLSVALVTTLLMMVMWGRHVEGDPTTFETVGRLSVVWSAAAVGGALGDILPGESKGRDFSDLVGDISESIGFDGRE